MRLLKSRSVRFSRMSKGVVPDGMAFVVNTFGQAGKLVGLDADQKKCGGCVFALQNIKNLWSPLRVGAVIESKHHLLGTVAITAHAIRLGEGLEILVSNELRVRIDRQIARAADVLMPRD